LSHFDTISLVPLEITQYNNRISRNINIYIVRLSVFRRVGGKCIEGWHVNVSKA